MFVFSDICTWIVRTVEDPPWPQCFGRRNIRGGDDPVRVHIKNVNIDNACRVRNSRRPRRSARQRMADRGFEAGGGPLDPDARRGAAVPSNLPVPARPRLSPELSPGCPRLAHSFLPSCPPGRRPARVDCVPRRDGESVRHSLPGRPRAPTSERRLPGPTPRSQEQLPGMSQLTARACPRELLSKDRVPPQSMDAERAVPLHAERRGAGRVDAVPGARGFTARGTATCTPRPASAASRPTW